MKMALDKVAFLPFGLLIDKWRWDVFSGKTAPADYKPAWWELQQKYQGVAAPVARSEDDFDPGAKYHVAANTPYMRYFLARIYQFQFHRALCQAAGFTGPARPVLDLRQQGRRREAHGHAGAGREQALARRDGGDERRAARPTRRPMLEYFAPLAAWLEDQNKGRDLRLVTGGP